MMQWRRYLAILALCLSAVAGTRAQDGGRYATDSVCAVLAGMPLHDIEGLWQLTDDGATAVIWRAQEGDGQYRMELVCSPDLLWRPGLLMADIKPSAQPGVYEARVYDRDADDPDLLPTGGKSYVLTLEDATHLSFRKIHSGPHVSPVIVFPYIMRQRITFGTDRPKDLDGALLLYPVKPSKGHPRYL